MSGKQAKAERRAERAEADRVRMVECVAQAHDRLHKDDVDAAHELLHQALGSGEIDTNVAPLAHVAIFDREFRDLCLRHGAKAAYVAEDPSSPGRLLSGGDAAIDRLVNGAMRESLARLAAK